MFIKPSLLLSIALLGANSFASSEYLIKLKNKEVLKSKKHNFHLVNNFQALDSEYAVIKIENKSQLQILKQSTDILHIEPNYRWDKVNTPNDKDFDLLWGLDNNGFNEPQRDGSIKESKEGVDINALKAWEITKGSEDIVIAVIDTGIDYDHEDLKDNMWTNDKELNGVTGVDDDGNGHIDDIYGYDFINNDGDPLDDDGHGTHCAGTIGATHDNNTGVSGVMSKVKLMAVKFLGPQGGSTDGAIKSIDYAVKMKADILSNSWGGGGESQLLKEAIERANKKGITFIAAAGNSGSNNDKTPHYPSNYEVDNVISVAAHTANDGLASFSCFGKDTVHVAAPGHKILSSVPGNDYKVYSGTSMATPHVSGIVGLYLSRYGKKKPKDIRKKLMESSVYSYRYNRVKARGRVDAYNFLTGVKTSKPRMPRERDWKLDKSHNSESLHPYKENTESSETFTVPGAKYVRAVFEKIDVEKGYDKIYIQDSDDSTIDTITGKLNNYKSEFIEGDTLKILFKSDADINLWGYKLKGIDYIK